MSLVLSLASLIVFVAMFTCTTRVDVLFAIGAMPLCSICGGFALKRGLSLRPFRWFLAALIVFTLCAVPKPQTIKSLSTISNQNFRPGVILVFLIICIAAAIWASTLPLRPGGSARCTFPLGLLRGKHGAIFQKEISGFASVIEIYLALAISAVTGVSSFRQFWISPFKAAAICVIIVALGSPPLMAPMGIDDKSGLLRYSLLPLSTTKLLTIKECAVLSLALIQVSPLLLASAAHAQAGDVLVIVLTWLTSCLTYLVIGHSVMFNPFMRLRAFRISSSDSLLAGLLVLILGSSPAALAIVSSLAMNNQPHLWEYLVVSALASSGAYLFTLRRSHLRLQSIYLADLARS